MHPGRSAAQTSARRRSPHAGDVWSPSRICRQIQIAGRWSPAGTRPPRRGAARRRRGRRQPGARRRRPGAARRRHRTAGAADRRPPRLARSCTLSSTAPSSPNQRHHRSRLSLRRDSIRRHRDPLPLSTVRLPNAPRRLIGRERGRHALGERLPGLPRPQPIWIRERPLQPVARRRVGQVVQLGTRASG